MSRFSKSVSPFSVCVLLVAVLCSCSGYGRAVDSTASSDSAFAEPESASVSESAPSFESESEGSQAFSSDDAVSSRTVVGYVDRVVDGDTFDVEIGSDLVRVRLIGVDAPESVNPDEGRNTEEGKRASEFLAELLPRGTRLELERDVSAVDKYGRALYYAWMGPRPDNVTVDDVATKMVNGILVREGHAVAKRYPPDVRYADEFEAIAGGYR